jgi:Flp pilus assembly secretin CpaC
VVKHQHQRARRFAAARRCTISDRWSANGNIVAIGGLMKQQDQRNRGGVPGLMDIPIIGTLFKNTSRSSLKSELVILVKPTVIENQEDWKPSVQEAANRVRDWRHDEFGRYWKEEVVQEKGSDNGSGQPSAAKP